MSKFDAVLKRIEEALPIVPNQQAGGPPKPSNNPQQTMDQMIQNMITLGLAKDVKDAQIKLQNLANPQQAQQQKPATGTPPQPAV
jgi:hypothetical protein